MEIWRPYGVVMAVYVPLIAIFVIGRSEGRDLRPSQHGLAYQNNATAAGETPPEMVSFFGGKTSTASSVPLPEAKNMSDASCRSGVSSCSGDGGGGRREGERDALVVASVVCGATGVAFLVVAALLFLFQYQRQRSNGRTK